MEPEELIYVCEICQAVLELHNCTAICRNCGRMFDCSDLTLFPANAKLREGTNELIMRPGADPRDLLPHID